MKFRNDINGLRAIAVLIVVLFHFDIDLFQGGFVGVDVFFVISGYLMTRIIFTRIEQNNFSIIGFYLERGKRIIPALACLCLSLAIIGWFIILPSDYEQVGKHIYASISFLSNFFYWAEAGYFDSVSLDKWLLHTWSLSVEWQFYILYPIAITLANNYFTQVDVKRLLLCVAIISLLISIRLTNTDPNAAFYLLPARAWEMLAGSLIFLYPVSLSKKMSKLIEIIGFFLIFSSVFLFSENIRWPGYLAIIPVVGTILVIVSSQQSSILTNNLIATWLGKTSYSVYLWHWPIVVLLNYFELLPNTSWLMFGLFLSLLFGFLSYIFIESKTKYIDSFSFFVYEKDLSKSSRRLIILISMIAVISVTGIYINVSAGIPDRFDNKVLIADSESINKNPNKCIYNMSSVFNSPPCVIGNKDNIRAILIGDSHADALMTAITTSLNAKKEGLIVMARHSCPTIIGVKNTNYAVDNCADANIFNINYISKKYSNIPVFVINRASVYLYGQSNPRRAGGNAPSIYFHKPYSKVDNKLLEEYSKNYKKTMCLLSESNPVFITSPIPEMRRNVPQYMARKSALTGVLEDVMINKNIYLSRNELIFNLNEELINQCNISILDTSKYLCDNEVCYGSKSGRPLFFDGDHMSEFGNKLLVPMFNEVLIASSLDDN